MLLVLLIIPLALSLVGNQEMFNAYLIWGEKSLQTHFFGMTMPITWLISLDAFVSTGMIAGSVMFWRWYARHWAEPDEITKVTIGVGISALAPLTLAAASAVVASTGQPVSLAWALAFHILNDVGFSNVLPVALALYTRAAPKGLEGLMIAVYYLQLFLGNMLVGYVGSLYSTMSAARFWLLHVGIMLLAGAMLLIARRFASAAMAPPIEKPQAASA